jgi:hypothetical protein
MLGRKLSSSTSCGLSGLIDGAARIDSRCEGLTLYGPDAEGCTVLEEER